MHKEKVVYLDRDGVINRQALPHEYIRKWNEFVFLPGVFEALRLLKENGYHSMIITNQRGIARHKITAEDVEILHQKMCEEIRRQGGEIEGVYVCPHLDGECNCRKPQTGLFLQSEAKVIPDKDRSWMIGDSVTDVEAGKNYGVRTIFIGTDSAVKADHVSSDLLDAVNYILQSEKKQEELS